MKRLVGALVVVLAATAPCGAQSAAAPAVSGDSIPFLFRYDDGSRMHTTFAYDRARDTWAWRLDEEPAGKPDAGEPFARVTLTRVVGRAPRAPLHPAQTATP